MGVVEYQTLPRHNSTRHHPKQCSRVNENEAELPVHGPEVGRVVPTV